MEKAGHDTRCCYQAIFGLFFGLSLLQSSLWESVRCNIQEKRTALDDCRKRRKVCLICHMFGHNRAKYKRNLRENWSASVHQVKHKHRELQNDITAWQQDLEVLKKKNILKQRTTMTFLLHRENLPSLVFLLSCVPVWELKTRASILIIVLLTDTLWSYNLH